MHQKYTETGKFDFVIAQPLRCDYANVFFNVLRSVITMETKLHRL